MAEYELSGNLLLSVFRFAPTCSSSDKMGRAEMTQMLVQAKYILQHFYLAYNESSTWENAWCSLYVARFVCRHEK